MHNNTNSARFIIVSKLCSAKQISKFISILFKLVYYQFENFNKANKFSSKYSVCLFQNSDSIIQSLNHINKKVCKIYCNIWLFDIKQKATSW